MDAYRIKAKIFSYSDIGLYLDFPVAVKHTTLELFSDLISSIEMFLPLVLSGELGSDDE